MDRGEVLFWSWLSIITIWAFVLLDAVFSNFTSAWREFVVGVATLIGVVLGCVVGLGYLYWPSSSKSEATGAVQRPREFGEVMDRLQEQAEKDAVDRLSKAIIIMPSFGLSPYSHLTIHFSRKRDTPQKCHRPCYVINHSENNAFWAPDFVLKLASGNWIQWVTHDGEQVLQEYLDKNGIKLNQRYPTNYKRDLGISLTDLSKKLFPDSEVQQNKASSSSENLAQPIKPAISQESKIPPPFDIGRCPNCHIEYPVEPLSPQEWVMRMATTGYDENRPRLAPCPLCKIPAPVTPQPRKQEKN